ncbi:hypothetical protein OG875_04990 [Streptomyces sp. NBC_01498]|uniref:hypothetical protein n=1 Tax=Streptomyces sp. NBC_01498 TaxID=2975870 RepID=UPI002E7B76BE|nr:hypothetical protein [Streptomyces sp. NBC_01498]WTL24013.1 hypothetical protein OG875_04990 [Streptomyces sp. NBC_01498]
MDAQAFIPMAADMEYSRYGLHVSSLGSIDDPTHELIAAGTDVTPRRALAAFVSYARTISGRIFSSELRQSLEDGSMVLTICPTTFVHTEDGGWEVFKHQQGGAMPGAWLEETRSSLASYGLIDLDECLLCGAPGGYPFCNDACRAAAPGDDAPIHNPPENLPAPWAPGDPRPF